MKIVILSRKPSLYSTRRLREAGEKRGHKMQVIDYLRCYMNISAHNPQVIYRGRPIQGVDAIIPRIGASQTFYGTAVVRQFEMMGVFSANSSIAISRSRDKLRCLQILSRKGIGLPVTGFAHATKDVTGLIKAVGGPPLVVKLIEGTQGIGVVLVETEKVAESVIEAFRCLDANILVQEFIKEADGSDLRCFVVGDRVIAAMKRIAPRGDFRANLHRGGRMEKVKLTPEERTIATRAAKEMALRVSGVDLLRSKNGPVVIEVNSSPGLRGIEAISEVDIAEKISEYVERKARSPKRVEG